MQELDLHGSLHWVSSLQGQKIKNIDYGCCGAEKSSWMKRSLRECSVIQESPVQGSPLPGTHQHATMAARSTIGNMGIIILAYFVVLL